MREYLDSTEMIDSHHHIVKECADLVTAGEVKDIPMAIKLYYFVRDEIRYDPYTHFHKTEYYKASRILHTKRGNCICKAGLLCALARAVKIPARLGFANVRNHLATKQLIEFIGSKIFLFHGYTELFLNKKWIIATPAFNYSLCERHNVNPLDFDGNNDSIFQSYNLDNEMYMEYVKYHGTYNDIPLDEILSAWRKGYGEQRVMGWIEEIEKDNSLSYRNFYEEDIVQ